MPDPDGLIWWERAAVETACGVLFAIGLVACIYVIGAAIEHFSETTNPTPPSCLRLCE